MKSWGGGSHSYDRRKSLKLVTSIVLQNNVGFILLNKYFTNSFFLSPRDEISYCYKEYKGKDS